MANSKIPNVDLTDTFNTNRVRFNNLLDSVGDVSTLTTSATDVTSAINEHDAELGTITSGAMGTTAGTVSGAIAELDDRLDSINNTQIQSAKLLMNDSSAVSAIKGKLDVHGDLYAGGILYTDQIKSASASEQVFINDTLELQANDINDVANIHLRTALIHDGDTNTKFEFGTDTIDLHTGGTARVAITNNDVTISENLTVQDSAYVTGNLAVGGNTTIGGTLTVDGEVTFKAGANSNINLGDGDGDNVVFNADVNSSIIPNTDNTYDLGSSTKEWRHGYFDGTVNADNLAADSATLGTVKVTDLTAGRIVTVGTNGEVQDDADLTYSPTTDTLSVSNIDIGTQADLASAKVEDLTNNRIVIAGTGGELEDDANLTFDGTTLAATAAVDITGDLDVDNININGNTVTSTNTNGAINITPNGSGEVVISTATVSDLTNNRIVIAGTSGSLEDDANLTFDGTTFSATAAVDITGDLDVDNININGNTVTSTNTNGAINITPDGTGEVVISTATVSDLTDNRIIVAGTSGALEDDANLTFDGTTFTIGATTIDQASGNTNIGGDLDVTGNLQVDGTLTVDGVVNMKAGSNGSVTIGDANTDNVVFSADVNSHITPNIDNTYDLGSNAQQWRNIHVHGTGNIDTVSADDITVSNTLDVNTSATIATVKVEDLTDNRIVIVGTGGELEDDANLTYDGTTFEVGTNFDVDVATGNTNIDGNLDVDGTTDLDATNVDGDLDVTGSFTTITTDGLTEGDNLYYTTSRADSDFDTRLATKSTTNLAEGSNLYYTTIRADSDFDTRLATKSTTNLAEGDNLYYTTARADSDAKNAVSATDAGGDGSFTYNNATGVFTYTGPSATEVIAHISAGEGIDFNESGVISGEDATTANKGIASFSSDNFAVSLGEVSIKDDGITLGTETTGNYVATIAGTANEITVSGSGSETAEVTVGLPDDVTVGNNLTVTNDFTVGGRFTIAGEQRIAAQYIFLQDGTTGTPSLNSGITVDRGDEDSAVFQWNETGDYWEAGTKNSLNRLALQDDSANFTSLSVNNDLVVSGNLDIRGTTTTIDTTNLTIEDNLVILNGNQTGTPSTTLRSGLEIERGDDSNAKFQFNENTDEWEFTGPKTGTLAVTDDIGNATITLTAGTDLSTGGNFTTNQSGNETITINHADITRTNTTTTASPAYGASFTAIDTLTTNARGHVTGARTKTVTLPAAYSHPTHPGDSASIDTGALTGATVISDLDLNITTDSLGHVTDANAAVATRTLTLADLGYTGATDANNYSLPLATDTVRGGIELFNNTDQSVAANSVTTTAGRTYGLQLNSANQAVMNVPWTDTVYSHPTHDGDDISIDTGPLTGATVISDLDFNVTTDTLGHVTDANATIATRTLTLADLGYTGATDANNYSLPEATSTVRGGIELFSNTDQSVAANAVTTTAGRTYGLQLNSDGQGVINVPWTGAEPVNTIDSDSVTLLQTLDNPNVYGTSASDRFGRAVAADGKYLAISAPGEDTASFSATGVVYVHNILNGSLLHIIQDPNPGASNSFGVGGPTTEIRALDISGNWLIAGSSLYDSDGNNDTGIAYIFNLMTGALHKTLANPNGYSTPASDYFGANVAIDGHYAAVSAIGEDDALGLGSGKVYIFNAVTGALLHTLDNPYTGGATSSDYFGHGLSLSGKYLLVGAPGTGNFVGKAYIYNVITGGLIATIDDPNAVSTADNDEFGYDVSIDGNYAAISATGEDRGSSTSVGWVYIFKTTNGTWSDVSLLHSIVNPGAFPYQSDIFGRSVSISGDYGIFTAYLDDDDGSTNSGKAYIYNLTAGGLVSTLDNPNAFGTGVSDYFGYSATISGNYAAVGAMEEDDSDGTSSGKVYTYSLVDPTSTSYVTYAELNNLG